ncbi:MAG: carboxylesterase family protein [Clostridiales bacterium]|nr:carboxylesterase family protein [Clostridiales bacterium]
MKKVIRTPDFPIAETADGKLHGFKQDEVFHFHGVRYATAGRFEMPRAVEPWEGVKDAKAYGYICPLLPEEPHEEGDPGGAPENSFEMPHVYWPMSENCQYLNVWTKHLGGGARRPVLVWLHGGGFCSGSSIEIPAYDGHNLADYGDVVVVNLNHRLNVVGYLDLSSFGEKYRYSGILGMADIVEALRWVQRNIAAFGGNPDNVTIAGQSGGGGKVAALMQMSEADGLYAKAVIESGALRKVPTDAEVLQGEKVCVDGAPLAAESVCEKAAWQRLGRRTVEELGLNEETVDQICQVSYQQLSEAATRAAVSLGMDTGMMMVAPSPVEGYYPGSYVTTGFRRETREIPLLIGTTLGEFTFMHYLGNKDAYTEEEKKEILRGELGDQTEEILKEFTRIYPEKDILYAMSVDTLFRRPTAAMARSRAAFATAPVYAYQMSLIVPYLGGIALWHCGEIPYVFRNVEMEAMQCTGDYTEKLQEEVSRAWANFMETSSPAAEGLPWDPYTEETPNLMFLDEKSAQTLESDQRLLELLSGTRPPFLA